MNLGSGTVAVEDGKKLVLSGDVASTSGTIQSTDGSGTVELKDAEVKGDLTITAETTLSGAVSVVAGKTLTLADATVAGTLTATGNVVADDLTVKGPLTLGAEATLTVNEDLTKNGGSITAKPGAQITVGAEATATGLLAAVAPAKFYDESGDEIATADGLKDKTFVWREAGWDQQDAPQSRVAGKPAGWVHEGFTTETKPAIKDLHVAVIDNAAELISTTKEWGVNGDATEDTAILKKWTGTETTETANTWLKANPYVFIHWERNEGITAVGKKGDITIKCGETAYTGVLNSFGTFGTNNDKDNRANSYFLFKQGEDPTDAGVAGTTPTETTSYTITVTWDYEGETKTATDTYEYVVAEGTNE